MILFIVAFFIVVGIGILVAAKLAFGGRKTRPDELPLGCKNIGNKIQCTAFD